MKCHNCGMSLPDDSEFCQYCGEKVSAQMVQAESVVGEAFNNNSTTPHDETNGGTGGGRFLVDGPDGMPVWINADQLGKKQTANEEELHKLKESIKARLISDYLSQDYTEKTTLDYENNICPSCSQKLPKESEFCPYCGMSLAPQRGKTKVELFPESKEKLSTGSESSITPERPQPARSANDSSQKAVSKESESLSYTVKNQNNRKKVTFKHCKKCGGIIDPKSRMCTDCRKQYFVPRYGVPIIILSVLLAVSLGISAFGYIMLKNNQYEINRLSEIAKNNDRTIIELRNTKNELQDNNVNLQHIINDKDRAIRELSDDEFFSPVSVEELFYNPQEYNNRLVALCGWIGYYAYQTPSNSQAYQQIIIIDDESYLLGDNKMSENEEDFLGLFILRYESKILIPNSVPYITATIDSENIVEQISQRDIQITVYGKFTYNPLYDNGNRYASDPFPYQIEVYKYSLDS